MAQVGNFDPRRFDKLDLWEQTEALTGILPGWFAEHVEAPQSLSRHEYELHAAVTWRMNEVEVCFDTLTTAQRPGAASLLASEIEAAMGRPVLRHGSVLFDESPQDSPDPDRQRTLAERLRAGYYTIRYERLGEHEPQDALRVASRFGMAETAVPLTRINLELARLAGVDTAVFEAAVDYAPRWKPSDSVPSSLSWLAGRRQ